MLQVGDLAPPLRVQPVFGMPVKTGGRPLVVCFVRSLSGGFARAAIARLEAAWARFDAAGVGVVVLTRCDLTLARDYVPREHLLVPVAVDPTGAVFDAWGVGRDRGLAGTLRGLRPSHLRGLGEALSHGRARPDGGLDLLPADFVVGADQRLRYVKFGRTLFDLPDIEALWEAVPSSA